MSPHARVILWAQWRSWLNYYPKSNRTGAAFGAVLIALWYGLWLLFAFGVFLLFSDPEDPQMMATILPPGLFFVFVYWQVVPVLLAATGVSLEMKKLQVYPIPHTELFLIEVLLRVTASFEMLLLLMGLAAGVVANPQIPALAAVGIVPFVIFNLCVSAGIREILVRVLARKRVREVAVLLLVSIGAIPQLLVATGTWDQLRPWLSKASGPVWPWSATALLVTGELHLQSASAMVIWTVLAYLFGRWQFERSLRFDVAAGNATRLTAKSNAQEGLFDRVLRWPDALFADPLAALIKKEIRFLSRAPRFRLVFTMGFTFGLVIWLPLTLGRRGGEHSFFAENYLTFICIYALLLLGDVCFWNVFGFDRTAAQAYYAMPVKFSTVLAAKNISALFFVLLEITMILLACGILTMPMTPMRIVEAYSVTLVLAVYLMGLGNLTSTSAPRAVNPSKSMRTGSSGKMQAMLFLLYPVAALPVLLAYGARYAFQSQAAFFAVLVVSALIGAAVYWVAMESAVETADKNREGILAALSQGEGIIQA